MCSPPRNDHSAIDNVPLLSVEALPVSIPEALDYVGASPNLIFETFLECRGAAEAKLPFVLVARRIEFNAIPPIYIGTLQAQPVWFPHAWRHLLLSGLAFRFG